MVILINLSYNYPKGKEQLTKYLNRKKWEYKFSIEKSYVTNNVIPIILVKTNRCFEKQLLQLEKFLEMNSYFWKSVCLP